MKKALVLLAVVVAAVAAYWFAAPYVVMHGVLQAAQARDTAALDAHVDYAAVRESLRGQVSATLAKKMGDPKDNPLAAIGSAIGMAVAKPLIDVAVQPDAVAASLRNGQWEPVAASAAESSTKDVTWTYQREGFDRFVATSTDSFVFVRHGFADWKLEAIRLTHN
jgi:hypothetical protein